MQTSNTSATEGRVKPLVLVTEAHYAPWLATQSAPIRAWLEAQTFRPERGRWLACPDVSGEIALIVVGAGAGLADAQGSFWTGAALADRLPPGRYQLADGSTSEAVQRQLFALGWGQGSYRFERLRSARNLPARPELQINLNAAEQRENMAAANATRWARDLVNLPANELGPLELQEECEGLVQRHGRQLQVIEGEALLRGYPLIAAVGRGSARAPRLLDLRFGEHGRRVTLVGKGVCFDSGGLDLKTAAGMLLMKKDMGGAACALATAQMLCELGVPLQLRVLIPAVENAVGGNAFRPGDVIKSRKGLTVEIGNTDAEGRLILADALAAAGEEPTDLIIDFATLTGAARVALGGELPAAFCADEALLQRFTQLSHERADPIWPLPLWEGYDDELASRVADLNNAPAGGLAGAITAALFLKRFVADPKRWIHLDLYAWNGKDRPGRPLGAEAHCVRAVTALLQQFAAQ